VRQSLPTTRSPPSSVHIESNTRSATILGVVGAGGIGLQLADRIRVNNWDEVGLLLIMLMVAVTIIDLISKTVRLRLIHAGETPPEAPADAH
jgi:phosphonate transport system permease protein